MEKRRLAKPLTEIPPEVPPLRTGKWKDIKGMVVGDWVVIHYVGRERWACRCNSCGGIYLKRGWDFNLSKYKRCLRCVLSKTLVTHGNTGKSGTTTEYRIWRGMINRCHNPADPGFKNYGGRGIEVCESWHTFENFLKDMGKRPPRLSVERINNNDNYELSNCKWATVMEQGNNRRTNRHAIVLGKPETLANTARIIGYHVITINRIFRSIPKGVVPFVYRDKSPAKVRMWRNKERWKFCWL